MFPACHENQAETLWWFLPNNTSLIAQENKNGPKVHIMDPQLSTCRFVSTGCEITVDSDQKNTFAQVHEHLSDVFLYHRFKQSKTSSGGVLPVLEAELVPTHNSLKLQLIRQLF